ncbi:hypothetical protein D3C84_1236020 [compost metagenome]
MSFDPNYTIDHGTALKSVAKLQQLDLAAVIAYHGGLCTENLQERLQEILTASAEENGK